jgi:hypothetical protein
VKRCFISLAIKDIQIKTKYRFIQEIAYLKKKNMSSFKLLVVYFNLTSPTKVMELWLETGPSR